MQLPNRQPLMCSAHHTSHPLRLRIELRVAKDTPDESGGLVRANGKVDKIIPAMAEAWLIEIHVKSEKCRSAQCVQQWNNIRILHSRPPNIEANVMNSNSVS